MPGHQPVGVDGLGLQRLLAREGEQPLGQAAPPAARRAARARGSASTSGDGWAMPALEHLEGADDDGQQVVEVVRDAAGKLAEGVHLLRLAQALLGALAPRLLLAEPRQRVALLHRPARRQPGEKKEPERRRQAEDQM